MRNNSAMENRIALFQYLGGIITGLVIALVSAWALWQKPIFWEAMAWQAVMLALILLVSNPAHKQDDNKLRYYAFWLMLPLIYVLSWHVSLDIYFIYTIVWIAIVPHRLPRAYWWWSLLGVCCAWYFLRLVIGQENNILIKTLLEATFHMFALICSIATKESETANQKTQQLNRELLATQHLLGEASRGSERTRIARDLHDLLGHHLTALTINLQVASKLSEGQAKEKIDQCHALSKLLLNDVRESVSRLREMPVVNLQELLAMTLRDTPNLNICLEVQDSLQVDDVNTAEALLRLVQEAVTNTLKHSDANRVTIEVMLENEKIILSYSDNGGGCETLEAGNGLTGMRERIERLGGYLEIKSRPNLTLRAVTPVAS